MRLMGLDVGDKTIGVAVSDELGIVATPLTVIERSASLRKDVMEVRRLAVHYDVELIVVGMPYMLDGSVGTQAQKVQAFVDSLRRRVGIPVETWDERLTTSQVERCLEEMDVSKTNRRKIVDRMAASVILRAYMDRYASTSSESGPEVADEE